TKSKPDPEVFLTAAQRLSAAPENCVGVEDAAAGVEAIKRAGMAAVGIGEQGKEAQLVVDSVQELTVEKLRGLVEK
ncbi:MAG: HAD-IA family hydrolase, partial [Chitinivibrionales bacterium]|nr:HAD-IA family hydrolase [Chitinivibrionales bacterium]